MTTIEHATNRPAGLPATMEYGDARLNQNWSAVTVKDTAPLARRPSLQVKLEEARPGYEIAGSACRWTDGYFAVRYRDSDGAIQGRRFLLNAEGGKLARDLFNVWTARVAPVHSQAARDLHFNQ